VSQLNYEANSRQVFKGLALKLIRVAEHSFGLRDIDSLREASLVLQKLPIPEARKIGQYYQALAIRRSGKIDESLPLFEAVADTAPLAYRARALQTLGAIYHAQGRIDDALRLYPEAIRAASPEIGPGLLTILLVNQEMACIKSEMGDHRGALDDYEKLSPLVQIVSRENPLYFYFYHNELAVEFAELGRLAEAEAACAIALASPFARAYPEWSKTCDEIAAKRTDATPSVVAINRAPEAELLPEAEPERTPQRSRLRLPRCLPVGTTFCQRPSITIAAIADDRLTNNILSRLLTCTGPRAPPALS
jgi:tetratricopeptide (TPR) repeat protein